LVALCDARLQIDIPKGARHSSIAIIRSMNMWFSLEGNRRSCELRLNDAFKNAKYVAITASGQRSKHRIFTRMCHTMYPSSSLCIRSDQDEHLQRKEEATPCPLSCRRDLSGHHHTEARRHRNGRGIGDPPTTTKRDYVA
jgi:hypothetical protein